MAKRTKASGGKLVADCPCCKEWQSDKRGHVAVCLMSDGVTHAAPDMWIASRASRHERAGLAIMESWAAAWADWTLNCEMQARFEAQHAEAA